ncbi:Ctf18p NDAI_0H01330 [Naumovozyma dairenensis CBS 421]|uniref:AAA+ ATPase domain-containing protein n=1 Tax=Naumovozyma dairenensis (strain ATCC 10597 / BCRC 20456 / CBS 421 / NBRC 0211 / NRRL Y-12639) TaxID=1071378 RepID=G0WEU6_NAUDC|nr:hypothetical protein NDAI_0H01330 [Naumovozyma dairenensis CBS 421]CCD26307.1 hypothetical protein NDAI_0H01330 [Naumovozyma dairenensis CBS 421]
MDLDTQEIPVVAVPLDVSKLGHSSLFEGGSDALLSTQELSTVDVANKRGVSGDDDDDIHQFISCTGKVIKLVRKRSDRGALVSSEAIPNYQQQEPSNDEENDNGKAIWKSDQSYGININALLDRIESKSSDSRQINKSTSKRKRKSKNETLWVEKWRPKSFLDLVGNEKTNRRILGWLRKWAPAVFKEQLPQLPGIFGQDTSNNTPEINIEVDPLERPMKKILLIHGPPGIGKTSVAHVLAKQAGFTVSEINASDERAGPLVRDKIMNTLFNHTFNDKPVCLVADEIDGSIESGFIRVLIDIINNDAKATRNLKFNTTSKFIQRTKGKKNKKKQSLLLRPIIAVCNNLYAPALEKLKPHCEIISFKRPSDKSLQERLETISMKEHLDISTKELIDLMDLAEGDVRNCINNLQFLSSHSRYKAKQTSETADGFDSKSKNKTWESANKDHAVSWFRMVNEIFKKDPHRDIKSQFSEILHQIEQNGNYDRIAQGCFSLYPFVKYSDNGMKKPNHISDWLYFHDRMFSSLFEHNGELLRYSSIVPLVFFQNFGDVANKEDLRIKNVEFENREKQKMNQAIISSIVHSISTGSPKMLPFIDRRSLVFELLPFIDQMLCSDFLKLRDLNSKRLITESLLDILNTFKLNMIQIPYEGLGMDHVLSIDPPIDKVVLLDPSSIKNVLTKRPPVLHLLLAKIEESKVKKRHIDQVEKNKAETEEIANKKAKNSEINNIDNKSNGSTIDFFKKQYNMVQKDSVEDIEKEPTTKKSNETTRIWVKYKEGFSNAVRKNVTWESLWQ